MNKKYKPYIKPIWEKSKITLYRILKKPNFANKLYFVSVPIYFWSKSSPNQKCTKSSEINFLLSRIVIHWGFVAKPNCKQSSGWCLPIFDDWISCIFFRLKTNLTALFVRKLNPPCQLTCYFVLATLVCMCIRYTTSIPTDLH